LVGDICALLPAIARGPATRESRAIGTARPARTVSASPWSCPSFPAAIYASLVETDDTHSLILARSRSHQLLTRAISGWGRLRAP